MHLRWIHFSIVILVFSLSCDESLPPRQNPSELFTAHLQGYYVYTQFANNVVINLIAVNNFDETLSDRVGLTGTIVITSNRDSSVHKTIQLSLSNMIHGTYDPVKGTLTVNPVDSVVIQVTWDFTDDEGGSLPNYFFQYSLDRSCKQRLVAKSETFTISGKAKLYSILGYAQSQNSFTLQQYDIFIGPHDCIPL
jgi:hypothetical protein